MLGLAAYGHSFSVAPSDAFVSDTTTLAAYPAFHASNQPLGDSWDNTGGVDICGVYDGSGGTFNFWGLVDNGFLTEDGVPVGDIHYRYDECSQTVIRFSILFRQGGVLTFLLSAVRVQRDLASDDLLRQRAVNYCQRQIYQGDRASRFRNVGGRWRL